MPPDRQDPERRQREQTDQHAARGADRLVDPVREDRGHQADQLLRGARPPPGRAPSPPPVTMPMPYGNNTIRPAPSAAVRAADRLPSRSKAASAQPTPSTGSSTDPTPSTRHSREPMWSPQLPVMGSRNSVSPRNSPIARAPMPISSWRALRFM